MENEEPAGLGEGKGVGKGEAPTGTPGEGDPGPAWEQETRWETEEARSLLADSKAALDVLLKGHVLVQW